MGRIRDCSLVAHLLCSSLCLYFCLRLSPQGNFVRRSLTHGLRTVCAWFLTPIADVSSSRLQHTAYLLQDPPQQTFADLDLKSPIHPKPKGQLLRIATESAWKYSKWLTILILCWLLPFFQKWRPKVNELAEDDTGNRWHLTVFLQLPSYVARCL